MCKCVHNTSQITQNIIERVYIEHDRCTHRLQITTTHTRRDANTIAHNLFFFLLFICTFISIVLHGWAFGTHVLTEPNNSVYVCLYIIIYDYCVDVWNVSEYKFRVHILCVWMFANTVTLWRRKRRRQPNSHLFFSFFFASSTSHLHYRRCCRIFVHSHNLCVSFIETLFLHWKWEKLPKIAVSLSPVCSLKITLFCLCHFPFRVRQ